MFWFLRGHFPPASHCPRKLYFSGGGGSSVKRLKSSQDSSSHSGASGPSSITTTIWWRWDMSCRALDTKPAPAEGEFPDGPGAGTLHVELAPSVALGASNPGDGATLCIPAMEASGAPGRRDSWLRSSLSQGPATVHCRPQAAGWMTLQVEHLGAPCLQTSPAVSYQATETTIESCQQVS